MIPKIIHYCWISENPNEELPKELQLCIQTWKKYLPDYKIKRWNQYNFDINNSIYAKEALKSKKYAFVSDYIRIAVLYKYGGIYLDTDMKVIKSFNDLLNAKAFIAFENKYSIAAGIIGAEKNHIYIKYLLDLYEKETKHFIKNDKSLDMTPNPIIITKLLMKEGIKLKNTLQKNEHIIVYPKDYFYAYDIKTKELNITPNTYAIHLYNASWLSENEKMRLDLYKRYYEKLKKYFPIKFVRLMSDFLSVYKIEGIHGVSIRGIRVCKKFIKTIINNMR